MAIRTGQGIVGQLRKSDRVLFALRNFDIEGYQLKQEHISALRKGVVPSLIIGGSISLLGMTDRTGSAAYNQMLSQHRIQSVESFLKSETKIKFPVLKRVAQGEQPARLSGVRDNTRNDNLRCVIVALFPGRKPKDIDPRNITVPGTPGVPFLSNYGWVLEAGVGALDGLAMFLAGAAGTVLGAITAVSSSILVIVGGAVTIYEADKNAEFNGDCEGFWTAFQLMADQFSGALPDDYAKWPALKLPVIPKPRDYLDVTFYRRAHKGRQAGAKRAYDCIMEMERRPAIITVREQKVKLRGREYLRVLRTAFGKKVGDWMHERVDEELVKNGQSKWPIGLSNKLGKKN